MYIDELAPHMRHAGDFLDLSGAHAKIWAYCLMPNHVHVILVPSDEDGLRRTFADLHRRYTGFVNARARVTGHLWQGRYGSVVMDEDHLLNAVRYVTLNPVRAGLVERARDWKWSSARAHLAGKDTYAQDAFCRPTGSVSKVGTVVFSEETIAYSNEGTPASQHIRKTTKLPGGGEIHDDSFFDKLR